MSKKVLIINGPNLNMLGTREPDIYGAETLDDIKGLCEKKAKELSLVVSFHQSNQEGDIVDLIQASKERYDGIIINAGAYTHTSVAIRDALLSVGLPCIELHLSNIFAREEFRQNSFLSDIVRGIISGFGSHGYELSLEAMAKIV